MRCALEQSEGEAMGRSAKVARKTKETDITVKLDLDGKGQAAVETGMPFFNHMLDSFSRHGFFNIEIQAKGDLDVDLPTRRGVGQSGRRSQRAAVSLLPRADSARARRRFRY
jgi:hypothetical protein